MPEDPQLAVAQLAVGIGFDGLVHAQILMVAGKDLDEFTAGTVEKDEIFQQVEEVFLAADTAQHGLQSHAALVAFFKAFPFVEKFVLAAQRPHPGLGAVGEDEERIEVEQLWDGIQIIGIIVGIGVFNGHRGFFQFYEEQGNAIHEAHDVRPAAVQVAVDLHFLDSQEMIVLRLVKVDDAGAFFLIPAVGKGDADRDTVTDKLVFFLVDLQQGGRGKISLHGGFGFVDLGRREPGVEPL